MFSVDNGLHSSDWDSRVKEFSQSNFLLSWAYVAAQQEAGYKTFSFTILRNDELFGACVAVLRLARRGNFLEVAAPVMKSWSSESIEFLKTELTRIAVEHNCVFVRFRPQVEEDSQITAALKELNFRSAHMHLLAEDTQIIDLTQSEEDLLACMRKNTRYEVKKARRQGIKVTEAEDRYAEFYNLQKITADRQGYILGDKKLLESEFQNLLKAGQATLYAASSTDGVLLNMALIANFGDEADYLYGASTEEGLKMPGAYALQWQAIKDAKAQGFARYNMWGVAPEGSQDHRFSGVTMFKKGFGGSYISYVHAHDIVVSKLRYGFVRIVEYIRKKRRGL